MSKDTLVRILLSMNQHVFWLSKNVVSYLFVCVSWDLSTVVGVLCVDFKFSRQYNSSALAF